MNECSMHKRQKKKYYFAFVWKTTDFFQKSDLQQRKMKNCEVNNGAQLISETSQIFQTGFTKEKKACYTKFYLK